MANIVTNGLISYFHSKQGIVPSGTNMIWSSIYGEPLSAIIVNDESVINTPLLIDSKGFIINNDDKGLLPLSNVFDTHIDFTVEAYLLFGDSTRMSNAEVVDISDFENGTGFTFYGLSLYTTDSVPGRFKLDGINDNYSQVSSLSAINTNAWNATLFNELNHIAITYKASSRTIEVYVNNVLAISGNLSFDLKLRRSNTILGGTKQSGIIIYNVYLPIPSSQNNYLNFYRTYNRTLTSAELSQNFINRNGVNLYKTDWKKEDFINSSDFNRIEGNTDEVRNYLNSIQYDIPTLTTITNRTNASIDFVSSINRIENNIEVIKNNFATPLDWKPKVNWSLGLGFTHDDVNRLENNLKSLLELGQLAFQNFKYCGTVTCGEEGVIY